MEKSDLSSQERRELKLCINFLMANFIMISRHHAFFIVRSGMGNFHCRRENKSLSLGRGIPAAVFLIAAYDYHEIQSHLTYVLSTVTVLRSYEKHYVENRR